MERCAPVGRREKPVDPEAGPVQRLAHDLRVLREKAGSPTYREMARRTHYSSSALSHAAGGEQLASLAVVLAYATALDADPEEWEERWREAKGAVEAEAVREVAAADEDTPPPYRGLARFEPSDSDLFFGRDRLLGELLELLREHRFAAVTGPSGSGKSSLLRAGLIPALRGASGDGRPAVIRVLTPGERPAHTHAGVLTPQDGEQDTWVIVDQFEELFTLCQDRAERDRFLDLLLAAREPESRLRVVVAVRGDFYGHCAAHRELAEAVGRAGLLVGPMGPDELREVITKPAAAAGLLVERALTARIIDEVGDEPGALPSLSHALLETWRRRRGRTLTTATYEAAGGVHGAIAVTAEHAYAGLSVDRTRAVRRVLLRLVVPGEGTADTRRPAERTELDAGPDAPGVVEHLAANRLVTLDGTTVELAHEALITGWPRLAAWIEEDRERLLAQRRLDEAARLWEEVDGDPGALYRGTQLARAEELFGVDERAEDDLTPRQRVFLTASRSARGAADRKRRALTATLCALLVLALAAGLVAWQQNRAGDQEAAKAAARRIAASAAGLRAADPRTSALLGVAAWRVAPLAESRSALLGALFQPERDAFTDPQDGQDVQRFLTGGGRTLVSVDGRRVSLRDVTTGRRTASYTLPDGTDVITVGQDARTFHLSGPDGERLWHPATGTSSGTSSGTLGSDAAVLGFTATADGYLVSPDDTGSVQLRRTADDKVLFTTSLPDTPTTAALDAHGRVLALCPAGGAPQLWDTARRTRLSGAWDKDHTLCGTGTGADDGARVLSLSPDGTRLAAVSGTALYAWDVHSGQQLVDTVSPGDGGFIQAAFTPDGRFLATADSEGLAVWRLTDGGLRIFRAALTGTQARELTWDPGKDRVLRFLDGTTVRSYDVTARLAPRWQTTPADATVLSPDGATLATATSTKDAYRFELRSTRTGRVLAHSTLSALPTSTGDAPLLVFSPDGRALVTSDLVRSRGTEQQRFTVWDVPGHKVRTSRELAVEDGGPLAPVALGPDGRTLLLPGFAGNDATTEVWQLGTGNPHRTATLRGLAGDIVAARPDGHLLVGSDGRSARLPSGRVTGRELADGRKVTALAFSRDGSRLAVGDESGRVTLWDGDAEHRTGVLTAFAGADGQEAVTALAFSSDGRTLAIGGADSTLQLWDTSSQQLLGTDLPTSGDEIRSVAFGEDGGTLYAAAPHTPLLTYRLAPGRAAEAVCARTGGGLTRAQWRTYVPDAPYREICGGT